MLTSFAGGRLFGASWGKRPADVVALHGWQRTHRDFTPVFDSQEFADGGCDHGAIAVDLFGFGATPAPPTPWGTAVYADNLLPVFDQSDVADQVTLVGHSFGGRVAVRLAVRLPDRIERLVLTGVPLLDCSGRRSGPAVAYRAGRRLYRMGLVGERRMEALRQRYGSADYRAARGVIRDILVTIVAEEYAADMAAVRCPVDLIWGDGDTVVPVEVARAARNVFPHATLRILPGIGHLVPIEAPVALRQAILDAGRSSQDQPDSGSLPGDRR